MQTIYVEDNISNHPRVLKTIQRLKPKRIISCKNYHEVFNCKGQNFRIQKQNPALILAKKTGNLILPAPEGFGIGGKHNFYFSHLLNCLYDCRYCYLQGMYSSANYVNFINYEDMMQAIKNKVDELQETAYFFSGYDSDSLAYEPTTGFVKAFLPFFAENDKAFLELRTKSPNIRELLKQDSIPNCVVAFSFLPEIISQQIEYKAASISKRIEAMEKLARQGWKLGLRLDPLILTENFKELYQALIERIFSSVSGKHIHSVSIGPMRFPEKMYQRLIKLYPHDKILAQALERRNNHFTYTEAQEEEMKAFVLSELGKHMNKALVFECSPL